MMVVPISKHHLKTVLKKPRGMLDSLQEVDLTKVVEIEDNTDFQANLLVLGVPAK